MPVRRVPLDVDTEKFIKVIALKNSIDHNGKAQLDTVISKFLGSRPHQRSQIKLLIPEIKTIVQTVNSMPLDDQKSLV